jgi:hypothetical protein
MRRASRLLTVITIALVLLGGLTYFLLNRPGELKLIKDSGENISDYSAVFMVNGQVYFGKLYREDTILDLRDIYYLKGEAAEVNAKQNQSQENVPFSLVKLGDELHGPNDRMRINSAQVLFVESLKNDSKVVQAIVEDKKDSK